MREFDSDMDRKMHAIKHVWNVCLLFMWQHVGIRRSHLLNSHWHLICNQNEVNILQNGLFCPPALWLVLYERLQEQIAVKMQKSTVGTTINHFNSVIFNAWCCPTISWILKKKLSWALKKQIGPTFWEVLQGVSRIKVRSNFLKRSCKMVWVLLRVVKLFCLWDQSRKSAVKMCFSPVSLTLFQTTCEVFTMSCHLQKQLQ